MVLVTGGTGLVGGYLLMELAAHGRQVRALCRASSNRGRVERLFHHFGHAGMYRNVHWMEGDILDVESLDHALEGVTEVYHCAALVSYNPKERDLMHKVNVEGTANVVNCCLHRGDIRLCHVSSVAALGKSGTEAPIDEQTPWVESSNNAAYGVSKRRAEMEVWRGIEEGLDAYIVNPCIIIGAGAGAKSSERIFSQIDGGLKFYGSGSNSFVDVRDVTRAMMLLMHTHTTAQRFVVAAQTRPFIEVFNAMADALQRPRPSKMIGPTMAALAWRLYAIGGAITRKSPLITRETMRTAMNATIYRNTKLLEQLPGFSYRDMETSVREMASVYVALSRQKP